MAGHLAGFSKCDISKREHAPHICVQLTYKTTEVVMFEKPWQEILRELGWFPNHETVTGKKVFEDKEQVENRAVEGKVAFRSPATT